MGLDDVREPRHGCRRCPIRVLTSFGDLGGSPGDDVASSSNHVIAKQAKKSKSRFHIPTPAGRVTPTSIPVDVRSSFSHWRITRFDAVHFSFTSSLRGVT